MNLDKILFTICFVSITAIATGQEKGYYSIGNNAEKLKVSANVIAPDSFFRADKGYYSMGANRRKLKRALQQNIRSQVPEIKKGYYSIGNNASQLRKSGD